MLFELCVLSDNLLLRIAPLPNFLCDSSLFVGKNRWKKHIRHYVGRMEEKNYKYCHSSKEKK